MSYSSYCKKILIMIFEKMIHTCSGDLLAFRINGMPKKPIKFRFPWFEFIPISP